MPVRFLAVYSRSDGGSVSVAYQPAAINLTRQKEFSVFYRCRGENEVEAVAITILEKPVSVHEKSEPEGTVG